MSRWWGVDNPLASKSVAGKDFPQEKNIRKILVQKLTLKSSYVGPGITSVVVLAERWNFYMDILIRDSFFTQSIWTIHFWESLSNESTTHPALSKRTFLRRDTVSRINTTDITFLLKRTLSNSHIVLCNIYALQGFTYSKLLDYHFNTR